MTTNLSHCHQPHHLQRCHRLSKVTSTKIPTKVTSTNVKPPLTKVPLSMIVIIFFTVVPIGVKTYLGELHLETCADHQGVLHLSQTDCDEGFSFVPNLSTLLSIITNILNYFLNYLGELHLEICAHNQDRLHQRLANQGHHQISSITPSYH